MKMVKIFIVLFFLFLAAPVAGASIGVAIAPATGTFSIPLDGEELEFTVYNTGNVDSKYLIELGGNAAKFSSVEESEITIPANQYKTFKVKIDPSEEVKKGDYYELKVLAKITSAGNMATGAESRIKLSFYGIRTRPYPPKQEDLVEPEKPLPKDTTEPKKEPSPTGMLSANQEAMAEVPTSEASIPAEIVFPILLGVLIGGVALVFIKKVYY